MSFLFRTVQKFPVFSTQWPFATETRAVLGAGRLIQGLPYLKQVPRKQQKLPSAQCASSLLLHYHTADTLPSLLLIATLQPNWLPWLFPISDQFMQLKKRMECAVQVVFTVDSVQCGHCLCGSASLPDLSHAVNSLQCIHLCETAPGGSVDEHSIAGCFDLKVFVSCLQSRNAQLYIRE